ncbi:MAG TPA: hypothetical protein VLT90_16215 [Terriglobales bacterium]|nr:hypothetical protein [Terriglobales bacterium]
MKWNQAAKSAFLALAVLAATSAFAGNKGTLHISEAAQINGQAVPAGEYKLQWDGAGPNVQVSVMQGKKVIATVPAQIVEQKQASSNDSTIVDRSGSTPSIKEVRFAGKKYTLAIGSERAQMGESSKLP